jgi:hypothetical protein
MVCVHQLVLVSIYVGGVDGGHNDTRLTVKRGGEGSLLCNHAGRCCDYTASVDE